MAVTELKFPLDLERLPEYRSLVEKLRPALPPSHQGFTEPFTTHVIFRLWVELGYQAQSGAPLGQMDPEAQAMFLSSLEAPALADKIMPALLASGLLRSADEQSPIPNPQSPILNLVTCPRFTALNPHLAADFKSHHVRMAGRSALVRQRQELALESQQLVMTIPGERMRDRTGLPIGDGTQEQRMVMLVKTLDRVLKRPRSRSAGELTEGLIHDAVDCIRRYSEEHLQAFYKWLLDHRDKPGVPNTAEQILAQWQHFIPLSLS